MLKNKGTVDLLINLFSSIITSASYIVAIIVFLYQKKRELKISAIKAGANIEKIVTQWSYVDMVLKHSFPSEYELLMSYTHDKMILFEKKEISVVYSKKYN